MNCKLTSAVLPVQSSLSFHSFVSFTTVKQPVYEPVLVLLLLNLGTVTRVCGGEGGGGFVCVTVCVFH